MDRLQTHTLLLEMSDIPPEDVLDKFNVHYDAIESCVTRSNTFVVTFPRRINFCNGINTITKKLRISKDDIKMISGYDNLPYGFLIPYMSGDFNEEDFKYRYGKMKDDYYMKTISKMKLDCLKNKFRMDTIKSHNISQLEDLGLVNEHNRSKIIQMKEAIEKEAFETKLNPDLDGPFEWIFTHYDVKTDEDRGEIRQPSGRFESVKVRLRGYPNNVDAKKKCWWIHSDVGGFGKSYFLRKFAEKFNAQMMTTSTNVINIPKNTQWLLFDEAVNIPPFKEFKKLTSGSCTLSFNRKTFGANFEPRADVQVIVCANVSPYEFFGKFDNKLQKKIMSSKDLTQIDQRINYVKLDGDPNLTRRKFMYVTDWNEEEFKAEIELKRKQMMKGENKLVETGNFLKKLVVMYRMREGETGVSLDGLKKYVNDPNDWNVAQTMYTPELTLIPRDKRKDLREIATKNETFHIHKECYLFELESALQNKLLHMPDLYNFMGLDLNETHIDWYCFKKACNESFCLIDEDELFNLVITFPLGIKRKENVKIKQNDNISSDSSEEEEYKEIIKLKRKRKADLSVGDLKMPKIE